MARRQRTRKGPPPHKNFELHEQVRKENEDRKVRAEEERQRRHDERLNKLKVDVIDVTNSVDRQPE